MKNAFKFSMRFTGPFHRFEMSNKAGVFASADAIEECGQRFIEALKHEVELSKIVAVDGVEAAVKHMKAKGEERRAFSTLGPPTDDE